MARRLFKDDAFDYDTRTVLGGVYHRAADVGEVLATVERIRDGDAESWYWEWLKSGERLLAIAEQCEAGGHLVSARDAYLRACAYLYAATSSLDRTKDPSRLLDLWRVHRRAWERFCELGDLPVERVSIPYEGTELVGYVFRPARSDRPVPAVILNNGSDGPVHAMWLAGGAAAVRRGYLAITFDGPGQGHALHEQGLVFRHDWEAVVTPVVDFLLTLPDVDPARVGIIGISQAGYWVPRAVAFEKRISAAVADPGVMDVSASWFANIPARMRKEIEEGKRTSFDRDMDLGLHFQRHARQTLAFRMRPYGLDDYFDVFDAVRQYNLRDVVDRIECPLLITDPEGEQFWPGQSQELHDALRGPSEIVRFTAEEGADLHCEPMAMGMRDQRIFDWLDDVLGRA